MRPILLAVFAAALPFTAHADSVVFSGSLDNSNYNSTSIGSISADGYYLSIVVPYGALAGYTSTGGQLCSEASPCNLDSGVFFPDNSVVTFLTGSLTNGSLVANTTATYEYTFAAIAGDGTGGQSLGGDGPLTGTVEIDTAGGQFISADITYTFTPITSTPASVTPEPSSLILLGTGALSLAGAARRRFLRG